ncbi:MAG: 50S ribosomal protein L6 [Parcubacteria group bacterium CG23_combo_of_CG06-09_8_20_14_all_35_6]|nr:MAG: 50S ribosomal protein L6 [Parcubacteria group bacterium CG23_combo_of_CG06-09_8_20_14_all_35_6]
MSRIGKKTILIPTGTKAEIKDKNIIITGLKGELKFEFPKEIKVEIKDNQIFVSIEKQDNVRKLTSGQKKKIISFWGLTRSCIANMIEGVLKGYEKSLEFEGLGYKANVEANGDLVLFLGYSHDLRIKKIEGIDISVQKNVIKVSGFDKCLVGQTAATIKKLRIPDAYKGKGIRYAGEIIKKKPGKKAGTTT